MAAQGLLASAAHATKKKERAPQRKKELSMDDVSNALWGVAGPVVTNLGFSGCVGAAAGGSYY
jgi:hypothetical protein